MNSTNFCYWLQGYCEICGELPTPKQWEIIKDHLKIIDQQPKTTKTITTHTCKRPGCKAKVSKDGDYCYEHQPIC